MNPLHLGRGRGGFGRSQTTSESERQPSESARAAPIRSRETEIEAAGGSEGSSAVYVTKPSSISSKKGQAGEAVTLTANYFNLIRKPQFEFMLYRVDFVPDFDDSGMRKAFVARQHTTLGGYLFDGQSMIYLTHRLPKDQMEFDCVSREEKTYKMKIKNTGTKIEMTDTAASQILNLILRRTMDGLKMQLVGRNLYDPGNKVDMKPFKIELWPGYITSIRKHEEEILVCAEVSHKVMRQETIYEILKTCKNNDDVKWQDNFKKEIIGAIVLTDYNNKTYRVDDVDFQASPNSTFEQKGEAVSYKEYYETKYNRTIRDDKQPMLISNPKARDIRAGRGDQAICLVPELCRATGLTDRMRANFTQMKAMAEHTQMNPQKRVERLLEFNRRLHATKESRHQLDFFNTDISTELVKFKGRVLPQEQMRFGEGKTSTNNDHVDWTMQMKTFPMFQTTPLKRWVFIYPTKTATDSEQFLKLMSEVAKGMNYEMSEPKKIELPDDRLPSYITAMEDIMSKDPKMIMVVVPNNAADRYAAIKKMTCVNRAIPTQVIVAKTMMPKKGNMGAVKSIATKVVVQINCKLGGAPWMIKFPLAGTMTIGFDVTHDSRDRSKSYGAFIASMDIKKTVQFFSAVSAHKDGAEMSANICIHLTAALRKYKDQHDALPERIMLYRDGVGDGQIKQVHSQEVTKISQKLEDFYNKLTDGQKPKFSVTIVNKRINTRIFISKGNSPNNPNSGTIVDNTITQPERYDFFLVSQSVRQGTVAPTSYNVISDTTGLTPDQMQIITYKQTHLYYNWSGCVRVPCVVQYAHKLALLVGEYLHQLPSDDFDRQLYFL